MNTCRYCGEEVTLSTKFQRPAGWVHCPMPETKWEWVLSFLPFTRMRWYLYCRGSKAEPDYS